MPITSVTSVGTFALVNAVVPVVPAPSPLDVVRRRVRQLPAMQPLCATWQEIIRQAFSDSVAREQIRQEMGREFAAAMPHRVDPNAKTEKVPEVQVKEEKAK